MPKWCICGTKLKSKGRNNLCDICRAKLYKLKMENEEKIQEEKEIEEPPFEEPEEESLV